MRTLASKFDKSTQRLEQDRRQLALDEADLEEERRKAEADEAALEASREGATARGQSLREQVRCGHASFRRTLHLAHAWSL